MAGESMSDRLIVEIGADLSGLSQSLAQAGRDVSDFAGGTIATAAQDMSKAFESTGRSLEASLARAARTGKLSIGDMVESIIADLARVAIQKGVIAPIEKAVENLASNVFSSLPGRAAGGPVAPASAYLVGESGPEVFIPSGHGQIAPNASSQTMRPQIVMNVQAQDAQSFMKSEAQIAAMLTRALARGTRNL